MAPLAATLLCYYEEDRAFVMLVRLWMLRGLERLYEAGFSGLLEALDDFQENWLRGGDVAQKLVSRILLIKTVHTSLIHLCRKRWVSAQPLGVPAGT